MAIIISHKTTPILHPINRIPISGIYPRIQSIQLKNHGTKFRNLANYPIVSITGVAPPDHPQSFHAGFGSLKQSFDFFHFYHLVFVSYNDHHGKGQPVQIVIRLDVDYSDLSFVEYCS